MTHSWVCRWRAISAGRDASRQRRVMPLGSFAVLLLTSLAPAAALAQEPIPTTAAAQGLHLTATPGRACVEVAASGPRCLELPYGAALHCAAPTQEGWVAAGTIAAGGHRELLVVAERRGLLESLPLPATGRGGPRGEPALLVSDGRLTGLAWLEGTHATGVAVWASSWRDGRWTAPEEIASAATRLALAGTTLVDGRWLLVWTEFDGNDDETYTTVGRPGSWRSPHPLHPDNDVPDIMPAITGMATGALAAWSRFDGADYRLHLAGWEPAGWRPLATLPGAGATRAAFLADGDRAWLLYRTVEPTAWQLVELDAQGARLSHLELPTASTQRPLIHVEGATAWLEWPAVAEPLSPAHRGDAPSAKATTDTPFRYLAFGDSITQGNGDECFEGGYPGRLPEPTYLDCATTGCQVVNRGAGGETTAEGVSRLDDVLDEQGPWDVVLVMEGTNDICWHSVSNDTIEANLGAMATVAAARGVDTLLASIIHLRDENVCPSSFPDPEGRIADLRERIRDNLATVDADTGHRWWADPWSDLCPSEGCFLEHYVDWGHPDCSGYDVITEVFRGAIQAQPAPDGSVAVEPSGVISDATPTCRWNKEIPRDASWYQLQLDGPAGQLVDAWLLETDACDAWQCAHELGALAEGAYTWRVRGRNGAGRSAWVETPFTIQAVLAPGAPTPVAPAGTIGDDRPPFSWERESPIAANDYELEVSDELGVVFNQSIVAATACAVTTCAVSPFDQGDPLAAGAAPGGGRGVNSRGPRPWREPLAFALIPDTVFLDGFDSGDTLAWSTMTP